jgi:hypothetical protein
MPFRLRTDADEWFKGIVSSESPIRTKFDQYYLSLLVGLITGRNERAANAPEFIDYFIADYAPVQHLLVGLLIIVEANRLGVELTEKVDVRKMLHDYLDPKHPTSLSETGIQKLNDYANGGFSKLVEVFPQRPHHVEDFLQAYTNIISSEIGAAMPWSSAHSIS